MNKQLSLLSLPTPQDEAFLAVCRETAKKCGLREVSKAEIEARCKSIEGEYNELLKQLERKI